MKSIKILLLAMEIGFSLAMFSCDEEPERPEIEENKQISQETGELVYGEFDMELKDHFVEAHNDRIRYDVEIIGEGNLNNSDPAVLKVTYQQVIKTTQSRMQVLSGSFTIESRDGSVIHGITSYQEIENNLKYKLEGSIKDGTGRYAGIRGYLNLELTHQKGNTYRAVTNGKYYNRDINPIDISK